MASRSDFVRLLGDVEDYLGAGYRRERSAPAEAESSGAASHRSLPQEAAAAEGGSAEAPAEAHPLSGGPPAGGAGPVAGSHRLGPDIPADREGRLELLAALAAEVAACTRCGLCRARTHAVPGEGPVDPLVMVIGEGPGADEDASGRPFVGRAGQYLDRWLEAVQLSRAKNAYIANVVKCRPPENRDPLPEEMQACRPFLDRQIALVRPKVILTVGRISSGSLSGQESPIGRLRGGTFEYQGIPVIPTYHPSGVLRNPDYRAPVWDDLKRLRKLLDEGGSAPRA